MNASIDLNTLILIVIGGLVTWSLKGITSINHKLGQLNGRLGKVETWQWEHVKLDDERHVATERNLDSVWNQLNKKE